VANNRKVIEKNCFFKQGKCIWCNIESHDVKPTIISTIKEILPTDSNFGIVRSAYELWKRAQGYK